MPPTPVPSVLTPAIPEYFDYRHAAAAAGVSDADLRALIRVFEADYPDDLMLRKLHVLRACHAVARGMVTVRHMLGTPDTRAA